MCVLPPHFFPPWLLYKRGFLFGTLLFLLLSRGLPHLVWQEADMLFGSLEKHREERTSSRFIFLRLQQRLLNCHSLFSIPLCFVVESV